MKLILINCESVQVFENGLWCGRQPPRLVNLQFWAGCEPGEHTTKMTE